MGAMHEEAVITNVKERGACLQVDGVVRRGDRWLKASFTVHKPDILQMSNTEFREFAQRQLPHVTEEHRWGPAGEVLSS